MAKGGDDVLLTSIKTKFKGILDIFPNWFDYVSEVLLKKMDDLTTSSISKFEADIASTNGSALKNLLRITLIRLIVGNM